MTQPWQAVLDFWFLPAGHPDHLRVRTEWFRKDPAFDETIRARFGALVDSAVSGGLAGWGQTPQGALAEILVLDQFTRNIWRDTARAFAGDAQALELARDLVARGHDRAMAAVERQFAYLPFMHAEDLPDQERSVELYQTLAGAHPEHLGTLDFAVRHRDIIARFGRFPHRNAQLGRPGTPEEVAFLAQPGSGF
jgi:uncharacterized protein (DUF924 family)